MIFYNISPYLVLIIPILCFILVNPYNFYLVLRSIITPPLAHYSLIPLLMITGLFLGRLRLRNRFRFFLISLDTVGDNILKVVISDGRVNNARSIRKSRLYFLINTLVLSR